MTGLELQHVNFEATLFSTLYKALAFCLPLIVVEQLWFVKEVSECPSVGTVHAQHPGNYKLPRVCCNAPKTEP